MGAESSHFCVIRTGDIIGKTGSTDNASKMTTISNGAHLHFEARKASSLWIGLTGRIDPIPFINASLPFLNFIGIKDIYE